MKRLKRPILLITVLLFAFSLCCPVAAVEIAPAETIIEAEIQPRIGYAAHHVMHLDANASSHTLTFNLSNILLPMKQWTLKTTGFSDDIEITCILRNKNHDTLDTLVVRGNQEVRNVALPDTCDPSNNPFYIIVRTTSHSQQKPIACSGTVEFWIY